MQRKKNKHIFSRLEIKWRLCEVEEWLLLHGRNGRKPLHLA